ncbi:ABC-type transport system ATP-binding protein (substrate glucose) (plasmid) [Haloferax volcanii DS2]|uniref:Glucose import ATP-binding protein TsgD13 n=3 Tax=Haloferax volcanii TaxID=2246 RepID=TSGDD_HALVD|nr:ABC transporter ATP-binding protein [Haloferax volcanii]D4GPW3.1 RecName: Full=Glucose import ATP-binding protein TsgD13 [Haloferax volcanii DS2]ADE01548.1 ABC-type transport system ATP-binding protein (substrate glucose) [Haloferax volcanii DS2]MDW7538308.1 ABC transporter ATP-binding protein [Haloferax volcanii]
MTREPFLRMENIVKAFPGVVANDHIDLTVERGEIHGLLGENGAGKSTLMKILYGLYSQDDGEISLSGTRLRLDSPQDAIDAGIGMVHQHFMLIPRLTVAENVVLGEREPATPFRPDADAGGWLPDAVRSNSLVQSLAGRFSLGLDVPERRIQELADRYGFDIDVSAKVWELGVGQQQRVEILKALYRDVDLLILDEPTAVLTPTEADLLFDSLERLTDEGVSIIFITHKLEEVEAVVDRVTVLRDGENVGTVSTSDVSRADLAEMMVGREVLFTVDRERVAPGEPVLRARNVSATDDRGIEALSNVDLTVRRGEVVGIAGVSGNGQKELAEVIAGLRTVSAGELTVDGRDLTNASPRTFIDNGVSFVPEDRNRYGSAGDLSVMHNAAMKDFREDRFGSGVTLDYGELRAHAEALVEAFDVRGVHDVTDATAGDLSGGNLQKLILAREISRDPDLLVANQPTRGVDVGAIESIREAILDQRTEGTGVVLLSEDLDEIIDLSDRILVVYEGEVVYETTPEDADRERIGLEMTGGGDATATAGAQVRGLGGSS